MTLLRHVLIRHGESDANAGAATSDPASPSLTARGQEQARLVASSFTAPPALIVTSPYLRTKQTAAPTIARFPAVPVEEWPVEEFTFLAPGPLGMSTSAERRPLVEAYWERAEPDAVDGGPGAGAESFTMLLARVDVMIARLRAFERKHMVEDACVAVFCHGQFMRTAMWSLLFHDVFAALSPRDRMLRFRAFELSFPVPNAARVHIDVAHRAVGVVEVAHLPQHLRTW